MNQEQKERIVDDLSAQYRRKKAARLRYDHAAKLRADAESERVKASNELTQINAEIVRILKAIEDYE